MLFEPTLSAVDEKQTKHLRLKCQRPFSVQMGFAKLKLEWRGNPSVVRCSADIKNIFPRNSQHYSQRVME
jgi:hypothetical protein